jgi:predicted nucleic acid-binding protein
VSTTSTAFADSSALVKLYASEAGAPLVRALDAIAASHLARVEVPAAFWRKHRVGEISAADVAVLVAAFEADWFGTDEDNPRFAAVSVTRPVLDDAARLVARHGLRAYDAVQLASACATRAAVDDDVIFAAFDARLCDAAATEGFELLHDDGSIADIPIEGGDR